MANGFLAFLREYRFKNSRSQTMETAMRAANDWNCLPQVIKEKYKRLARRGGAGPCGRGGRKLGCRKPRRTCARRRQRKRKRNRSCSRRRRPRSSSRRRRTRSCGRRRRPRRKASGKRKRCTKQGPMTNNGYLNFLRWYRRHNCGMNPKDIIKQGAREWCSLSQRRKDVFRRNACKVSCSKRRRNTPLCRRRRRRRC